MSKERGPKSLEFVRPHLEKMVHPGSEKICLLGVPLKQPPPFESRGGSLEGHFLGLWNHSCGSTVYTVEPQLKGSVLWDSR